MSNEVTPGHEDDRTELDAVSYPLSEPVSAIGAPGPNGPPGPQGNPGPPGPAGGLIVAFDTDNNQGPVPVGVGWTPVTALQIDPVGNPSKWMEVELFIPTIQGPSPGNWYLSLIDIASGPNDTIMQAEFQHDGGMLKTSGYVKALIPPFSGQKSLVPAIWANTPTTLTVGGTGELAGMASLLARWMDQ